MDVGRHPNIRLLAYSEVEKIEGGVGDFRLTVRKKARYIDETKCTGCGACAEKCPTSATDEYNMGFADRKAVYRYFAQGIPSCYTIDATICRNFQPGKKCGVCAKRCQAGAVDYTQKDQVLEVAAGAVILATGYDLFDAARAPEYGYGRIPDVVTALEFERMLSASGPTHGHVYRPSDLRLAAEIEEKEKALEKAVKGVARLEQKIGVAAAEFPAKFASGEVSGKDAEDFAAELAKVKELEDFVAPRREFAHHPPTAKKLAFLQCIGSRDARFNKHCSGFCCMHAIKEAIIAREHDHDAEVYIFGMDIRAVGKGFEEYRNRGGREAKITYVRSRVAEVARSADGHPALWYEDTLTREVRELPVDLVILATACEASRGMQKLAELAGVELNECGFFKTEPLQPLDTTRPGIFTCGCAQAPMDIPESVAQASSAAARAAQVLRAGEKRVA